VSGPADERPLLEQGDIQTLERLSLESLDAVLAGLAGQRETTGRSAGSEFTDYRRYEPGDDVRRIDWNVYARLHELHVRTAPQEASLRLSVLLDASRSMDVSEPSKLRFGRRLAALLAAVALLRGDGVEVRTLSDGNSLGRATFDSGGAALAAMVSELERLPAGHRTDLRDSIRRAQAGAWHAEIAVLISDALVPADDLRAALEELAGGARAPTLVHLVDPVELRGTWLGSSVLLDSETGERREIVITPEARARYARRNAELVADVERECRSRAVHYVATDAGVDPLELLLELARRETLLRAATPAG
jgi:uncharacterized protein (DUF58 family)